MTATHNDYAIQFRRRNIEQAGQKEKEKIYFNQMFQKRVSHLKEPVKQALAQKGIHFARQLIKVIHLSTFAELFWSVTLQKSSAAQSFSYETPPAFFTQLIKKY